MNVHLLQHVPFEGPGSIAPWLSSRGANISTTRFFDAPALPAPRGLDLVIALGGPMSVNDEAALPWLVDEKRFIREAIGVGVPVLGICLGAQLIASALGARVYPAPQKEIGWFDIEAVPDPEAVFDLPPRIPVFHWHGETFDLPPGAVRLARSKACANQAFRIGRRVLALQFHLETTPEGLDAMVRHGRDELVGGTTIQSEAGMRAVPAERYAGINRLMAVMLERLTAA